MGCRGGGDGMLCNLTVPAPWCFLLLMFVWSCLENSVSASAGRAFRGQSMPWDLLISRDIMLH